MQGIMNVIEMEKVTCFFCASCLFVLAERDFKRISYFVDYLTMKEARSQLVHLQL